MATKPESTEETSSHLTPNDLKVVYDTLFDVRAKWRQVGLALNISTGTLAAVEQPFPYPADRLFHVLKHWLSEGSSTCTWRELINVLRQASVQEARLARALEEKYYPEDVKESPQHDKAQSDQKEQFNSNIKSIQKKFADLLTSTRKSLKEQQVDLLDLVAHLMGFSLFSAVLVKQEALLADRCRDLENADSIDRIFVILSPFWSFLDYEILEAIIDEFGTDNDHSNLRQYVKDLKKALSQVEPGTLTIKEDTYIKLYVKLDTDVNEALRRYRDIKATIARIFGVEVYALQLCSVEDGCIELIFRYPKVAADTVLPLSEDKQSELAWMAPTVLSVVAEGSGYRSIVIFKREDASKSPLMISSTEFTTPHRIKESQQPESATGPTITSSPIDEKKSESPTGIGSFFEPSRPSWLPSRYSHYGRYERDCESQPPNRLRARRQYSYALRASGRDVSTPLKTSPTETSTPHTVETHSMSGPSQYTSTSPKVEPEPDVTKESDVTDV